MSKTRTQYAKRNMVSGIVNKIAIMGLQFLIRSIIIQKLGAEYIGLNSLFSSILQVLNMAELGFSSAIVFSLYKPLVENDTKSICALLLFYRNVYRIIGIIILIFGLLLMPFLPHFINGSYPSDINLYLLFLIFLLNTVFSYLLFAYKNVLLSASQRQDIISNISTILDVCKCVIQIVFLVWLKNYYAFVIWNIIFTIANNLIVKYITEKKFQKYICKGKIAKQKRKEISTEIKGLAIGQFAKVARNSFDSVVLSIFCGLIDVAIYSNYYYVFNAVMAILAIIIQSINAGIGNCIATETVEKNYKDFFKLYFYFSYIGSVCTVCMFCLYQPFMNWWVGDKLQASFFTMILFCIYFYVVQIGLIRSAYANSIGIWWDFRWLAIGEMVCNLALNFILGWVWGMDGILIATIITVLFFSIILTTKKTFSIYFKASMKKYVIQSLIYAFSTLIVTYIVYHVLTFVSAEGLMGLCLKGLIALVLSSILLLFIYIINKETRNYIGVGIRQILNNT